MVGVAVVIVAVAVANADVDVDGCTEDAAAGAGAANFGVRPRDGVAVPFATISFGSFDGVKARPSLSL